MLSQVFGELKYDYLWEGKIRIFIYGKEVEVKLDIDDEAEQGISKMQENSFLRFKEKETEVDNKIQEAIFLYYQDIIDNRREEIDPCMLESLPKIKTPLEMSQIVFPVQCCIPEIEDDRELVLLFECKWNFDAGLGVKLVNEDVVKVGIQSEVLF